MNQIAIFPARDLVPVENASRLSQSRTENNDYCLVHYQSCEEWKFAMPQSSEPKIDSLDRDAIRHLSGTVLHPSRKGRARKV